MYSFPVHVTSHASGKVLSFGEIRSVSTSISPYTLDVLSTAESTVAWLPLTLGVLSTGESAVVWLTLRNNLVLKANNQMFSLYQQIICCYNQNISLFKDNETFEVLDQTFICLYKFPPLLH